jgi:CBS domain-containing protein
MLLKEIMKKDLVTVSPETTVREAAKVIRDKNVGCILVAGHGSLKGLLTDRDIACWLAEGKDPDFTKVSEIMREEITFCGPETDIFEASKIMASKRVRRLPVQSNGKLEGIVSISDLAPIFKEEVDNFFHIEEIYHH